MSVYLMLQQGEIKVEAVCPDAYTIVKLERVKAEPRVKREQIDEEEDDEKDGEEYDEEANRRRTGERIVVDHPPQTTETDSSSSDYSTLLTYFVSLVSTLFTSSGCKPILPSSNVVRITSSAGEVYACNSTPSERSQTRGSEPLLTSIKQLKPEMYNAWLKAMTYASKNIRKDGKWGEHIEKMFEMLIRSDEALRILATLTHLYMKTNDQLTHPPGSNRKKTRYEIVYQQRIIQHQFNETATNLEKHLKSRGLFLFR
jgi:hypothetical protein